MGFLESIFTSLGGKFLANIIVRASERILKKQNPIGLKARYFHELKAELEKMPFIYSDIKQSVLNDFVDIKIERLDLATLQKRLSPGNYSELELLREKPKAIFLGNAGIGKTTFFRHTLLNIVERNFDKINELKSEKAKKLIPVYIPLKILRNNRKSPIVRYILENVQFFKNNYSKLIKYAQSERLMLILDGYDEISSISRENYIRKELIALMTFDRVDNNHVSEEFIGLYENSEEITVWLSSRKEYYLLNRILEKDESNYDVVSLQSLVGIELRGIGDNRSALVKNIFDRYKENNSKYEELLSEELFITQLDASTDDEFRQLTERPLFLTVMTYLYVKGIDEEGVDNYTVESSYVYLIDKCVDLLIVDLDEDKVRNLGPAHKRAYLSRRNSDPKLMKKFVKYFAAQLYKSSKSVFDRKYLHEEFERFVKNDHQIQNSKELLLGLKENNRLPNIIEQIIYSGIFVYSGAREGIEYFDFPHRRFKEVLAANHFHENKDLAFLFKNIGNEELSELIYVFYELTDQREPILKAILELAKTNSTYAFKLLGNCLRGSKRNQELQNVLEPHVIECLDQNRYFDWAAISESGLSVSNGFKIKILKGIESWFVGDQLNSFELACAILLDQDPAQLQIFIADHISNELKKKGSNYTLLAIQALGQNVSVDHIDWVSFLSDKSNLSSIHKAVIERYGANWLESGAMFYYSFFSFKECFDLTQIMNSYPLQDSRFPKNMKKISLLVDQKRTKLLTDSQFNYRYFPILKEIWGIIENWHRAHSPDLTEELRVTKWFISTFELRIPAMIDTPHTVFEMAKAIKESSLSTKF